MTQEGNENKNLVKSIYPTAFANFGWHNVTSVAIVNLDDGKLLSSRFWLEEDAWRSVAYKIKQEMLKKLES